MTESTTRIRIIGNYTVAIASPDDCSRCGNADWADVTIDGVCGKCLMVEIERLDKDNTVLCAMVALLEQQVQQLREALGELLDVFIGSFGETELARKIASGFPVVEKAQATLDATEPQE